MPDTGDLGSAATSGSRVRTQRLESFSDGVFAIAVTLLVFQLAVPAGSTHDLLTAFGRQWPSYLAYVVSFSTVGALWLNHTLITEHLDQADSTLLRLNLLFLLVVSFLPFPTRLLADYIGANHAESVATTIYGVTLLLASCILWLLWRYALKARLVRVDTEPEEVANLSIHLTPGLAGYVVVIGIGLYRPVVAVFGFLAIALYFIIPLRKGSPKVRHRRRRSRR